MNYSLSANKFLDENERSALYTLLNKYFHLNLIHTQEFRDVVLLRAAIETGARAQELLNVTSTDLDPLRSRVFIRGMKKSNDRNVPITKELMSALQLLSEKNGGAVPKPFPISYQHFRRIWFLYRPVKKKLHSLRHSFAIDLFLRTKDILLVKRMLGHRSINNTMIYLEFAQDADNDLVAPRHLLPTKTQPRAQ